MSRLKLYDIVCESRDMFEGFDETELTEEYPTDFDISKFKILPSYAAKLRYAEEHLGKPIGRGSSRVVYRVDENKVLKLAKNRRGVAQNEVEIDWAGDGYYESIVANIFDFDRYDHLWVEMELAIRAKPTDFRRLWGVEQQYLDLYLLNKDVENRGRRSPFYLDEPIQKKLDENDNVQLLISFMLDSDSPANDLGRISSWGIVKRNGKDHLVLIDFGLTNEVYDTYYH
mgnify:CR=1 FL=1